MNILKDKVKPMYLKLLAAASGSSLVASVFAVVDAMMVGRYHGPNGTAALAVFNPVWSFVYCLGLLAGIGGSVLFANLRGQGEKKKSNEYFTLAIVFGIVLSVIATIIISLFSKPLFRFFGADDNLLDLAQQYLACIKFAIPCCVFSNILSAFLRNDDNPMLATTAVIIAGIFNAIGDYFFVFTCDMGIFGAGLATAIGLYISIMIMLSHFFRKKNTLRFVKPTKVFHKVSKIAITGFPTAITDLAMGIIGILFNRQIMKYLNADALSVYGIITQVTAFAQSIAYGAGEAAQPIMSQNLGAKQHARIKECLKYGLITSAIFGVFWITVTLSIPTVFVHLFMTPTKSVLEIAPSIIRAYGLSYFILPFNIFATYYFQAMMKPYLSNILSLARGAVISGIAIITVPLVFGGNGIWFAMLITEITVAIFAAVNIVGTAKKLKIG